MRLAVLLAAVLALAPACGVDCFDGGELEASYRDGQRDAEAANQAAYDHGKAVGLGLTREDGAREGSDVGYRDGYDDGYHS